MTNGVRLQSLGTFEGTPAGQLKKGDVLAWNFGETSEIVEIVKQTAKTIWVKELSQSGTINERRFSKTRLVVIVQK